MIARVAIFAGPSVPPTARKAWPGVTWLPPAKAGDFLRLRGEGFDAIGLIDGYFDHSPAPWHKEILAVMADGLIIAGAASMGALRAAELDEFGMVGVGSIYRAYRQGLLTGDDEVALVHAPERMGWEPLSLPMVEIRATLALALRNRLVDRNGARQMRDAAHDVYFVDRDWPRLSHLWLGMGMDETLVDWLVGHHAQLKRADAEDCINLITSGSLTPPIVKPVPETVFFRRLQETVSANAFSASEKSRSPAPSLKG